MPRNAHTYTYFRGLSDSAVAAPPGLNAMHMLHGPRGRHALVDLRLEGDAASHDAIIQAGRAADILGLAMCTDGEDVWRMSCPSGVARRLYGSD